MFKFSRVGTISFEKQMLFSLMVISVFCLLFVYTHPYIKTVSANGKAASLATKTKISVKPAQMPTANEQPVSHLPIIAQPDDSSGFLNSVNPLSLQNISGSNNAGSKGSSIGGPQISKQAGSYNPQTSSIINQDLESLNITVPKSVPAPSKLTNLY